MRAPPPLNVLFDEPRGTIFRVSRFVREGVRVILSAKYIYYQMYVFVSSGRVGGVLKGRTTLSVLVYCVVVRISEANAVFAWCF